MAFAAETSCLQDVVSMAAAFLKAHHISSGKTILHLLSDRFDYGQAPEKTLDGIHCCGASHDFIIDV